ncbi:hypothetical protein [Labrys wisconsinensis]|uniref:Uncharacterized protein n=1 Tax=Labrys wisconsinensis TaxID=425677 RepID=A0ABU0JJ69_9HYPH|nr:hypothetical protein [Labrys wisconsinensis]MDQ0473177.1 hypothetical protein [Labrys wisconsinensis]
MAETDGPAAVFRPLIGQYAWSVRRSHGSHFFIEFGAPRLEIRDPVEPTGPRMPEVDELVRRRRVSATGSWSLLVLDCDWRVEAGGRSLTHLEEDVRLVEAVFAQLDGQILVTVETSGVLSFDLGGRLSMDRSTEDWVGGEDDLWSLRNPDGSEISCTNAGQLVHSPARTGALGGAPLSAAMTIEEIDAILYRDWDPIGAEGLPADEYTQYATALWSMLHRNLVPGDLARYLGSIRVHHMRLPADPQRDTAAALQIHRRWTGRA